MIETLLITWRESLEAALIVGILLTYLGRSGERRGVPYVWGGAGAAVLAALVCAAASNGLVAALDPDVQELAQAGILFLAVAVLTWMVVWMHRNARALRGELHARADRALAAGRLLGLATIAFAAVFREGVETVLFLWGVVLQGAHDGVLALLGAGLAGTALAVATAWVFFRGFRFLKLQTFFRVTGVLLLLVAGGLLTAAVNKLIALDYLPALVSQVWNTSWLVPDDGIVGGVLRAFVGYRARPSLLEVLVFFAYVPTMFWLLHRAGRSVGPAGRDPTLKARAA
ncbi:MAG TPA: FTR1 family protein [Candidatus Binatia bacterium]|nr:FTR1 family protein [Candidatus Binatia bacterium]